MLARRTRSGKASAPGVTAPDGLGLLRLAALLQPDNVGDGGNASVPASLPTPAQLERAMLTVGMIDFAAVSAGCARCYRPTRIP